MPVLTHALMRLTTFPEFSKSPGEIQILIYPHAFTHTGPYDHFRLEKEGAPYKYLPKDNPDFGYINPGNWLSLSIQRDCRISDQLYAIGRSRIAALET